MTEERKDGLKEAYFAGGCFWCITPVYTMMDGVVKVVSGYSGGDEINPTYEEVKKQKTGHRETIMIIYDPERVSYDELLTIFLDSVDLFDKDGQFIDRGFSYTLAVYYQDEAEKALTEAKIAKIKADTGREVYISLEAYKSFYEAEKYHQDYYLKEPENFAKEIEESGRKDKFMGILTKL